MKQTLHLANQDQHFLSHHATYHRDQYHLVEIGEFTGMCHEYRQEMVIPEEIFEELILKLIKHNKTLQTKVLDVIKEEIQNPTRICERCHERITGNPQTSWCRYCLENHG